MRNRQVETPLNNYFAALTQEQDSIALANASALLKQANQYLDIEPAIDTLNPEQLDNCQTDANQCTFEHRLENKFEAIFFNLAGIKMAMPLSELGGIHKIENIVSLPGKPKEMLGLLVRKEERLQCIDTVNLVMPERTKSNKQIEYQFAIQLGKSGFAVSCENLGDTKVISKDDVKWRDSSTNRIWFAGTIKSEMCALLDPAALINQVESKSTSEAPEYADTSYK